ncbi:MAG: fumarylacetoacetate hydrolase family protein [Bacteroidetes bacterium]|nr:fumarylacetoacetate hydrolase family protein [Bacteroidota bacterium]HET6244914.1 fumarylacetoacetate hydrolase family protein [Bacteroidia bacterium]
MKIICIGRNYAEHAKELSNAVPKEPVVFLKPDTALLKNRQSFYYPEFSREIHHELELVIKISSPGKNIEEKFAHKYYSEISLGIDFTARDLQQECKEKGLPWEKAKAFDSSAPIGAFVSKDSFNDLKDLNFHLNINGNTVQKGNSKDMIFTIDSIISYVSKFFTLKRGDLIYTGTPAGVGPVKQNDLLECFLEGNKLLSFKVK